MRAIHLTAYGNPAQNLRKVEVSEPNTPSAGEALVRMEYAPVAYSDLLDRTRIGGNNTGGCKSAEHPKFARMAEVLCCLLLPCLVPALPASGTQGQAMGSRLSQIARFHRHNLQHPPRPPAVLRSTPDCRTRRTYLHLSYSYASPFGPALLMTQDPLPTLGIIVASD